MRISAYFSVPTISDENFLSLASRFCDGWYIYGRLWFVLNSVSRNDPIIDQHKSYYSVKKITLNQREVFTLLIIKKYWMDSKVEQKYKILNHYSHINHVYKMFKGTMMLII